MYFLERETPVRVRIDPCKSESVETSRYKQVAVCEDLDALKAFYRENINPAHKRRYKYRIISNNGAAEWTCKNGDIFPAES